MFPEAVWHEARRIYGAGVIYNNVYINKVNIIKAYIKKSGIMETNHDATFLYLIFCFIVYGINTFLFPTTYIPCDKDAVASFAGIFCFTSWPIIL